MSQSRCCRACGSGRMLNSLWTFWYCGITIAIHGYLVHLAAEQYNSLKATPSGDAGAAVCVCLMIVAVASLVLFLYTTTCKVNNYANDGIRFGRKRLKTQSEWTMLRKVWRHLAPVSQVLHITMAYCLLVPGLISQGRSIYENKAAPGQVWQTDLDAIFGQFRISRQRLALIQVNLTNTTSDAGQVLDGFVLLKNGGNGLTNASPCWAFINLCVAVLIYTIRYPAVFWYTHKGFTFLFSFQLLIAAILHLVTYCGTSVIYKLQLNSEIFPGLDLILNHPTTLLLYTICNSLVFFSSITVFKYGYSFYKQQYLATTKNCHASFLKRLHDQHSTCHGYVPHVTAMMVMLISTLCKIPLVYDYVHVYLKTGDVLILACIILEAIYLFFWIILWLFFTIKQTWKFRVNHSRICQSKASIYTIQNSHVNETQQGQGLAIEETANREDEPEKLNATESSIDFDRMSNDTELMGAMEQADEASTATDSNRDSPSEQGTQTGALRKKIKQRKNIPQKVTFGAVTSSPPRKPPRTQRSDVTDNQSHSSLDGKLRIVAQVHESDSNGMSDKSAPHNALRSSNHKMSRHSYDPTNTPGTGLTQTTLNPHNNYLHMGGVPSNISSNPHGASTSNVNPKDNVLITIQNSDLWSSMTVPHSGSNYRDVQIVPQKGKPDIGRRDSANFSLTSSQETSSNNSDPPALSTQV